MPELFAPAEKETSESYFKRLLDAGHDVNAALDAAQPVKMGELRQLGPRAADTLALPVSELRTGRKAPVLNENGPPARLDVDPALLPPPAPASPAQPNVGYAAQQAKNIGVQPGPFPAVQVTGPNLPPGAATPPPAVFDANQGFQDFMKRQIAPSAMAMNTPDWQAQMFDRYTKQQAPVQNEMTRALQAWGDLGLRRELGTGDLGLRTELGRGELALKQEAQAMPKMVESALIQKWGQGELNAEDVGNLTQQLNAASAAMKPNVRIGVGNPAQGLQPGVQQPAGDAVAPAAAPARTMWAPFADVFKKAAYQPAGKGPNGQAITALKSPQDFLFSVELNHPGFLKKSPDNLNALMAFVGDTWGQDAMQGLWQQRITALNRKESAPRAAVMLHEAAKHHTGQAVPETSIAAGIGHDIARGFRLWTGQE